MEITLEPTGGGIDSKEIRIGNDANSQIPRNNPNQDIKDAHDALGSHKGLFGTSRDSWSLPTL